MAEIEKKNSKKSEKSGRSSDHGSMSRPRAGTMNYLFVSLFSFFVIGNEEKQSCMTP